MNCCGASAGLYFHALKKIRDYHWIYPFSLLDHHLDEEATYEREGQMLKGPPSSLPMIQMKCRYLDQRCKWIIKQTE